MGKPRSSSNSASGRKIGKVLNEYRHHTLHSGSKHGPLVHSKSQAMAIAIHEAQRRNKRARK